jgi:hypothetical protein
MFESGPPSGSADRGRAGGSEEFGRTAESVAVSSDAGNSRFLSEKVTFGLAAVRQGSERTVGSFDTTCAPLQIIVKIRKVKKSYIKENGFILYPALVRCNLIRITLCVFE